MSELRTDLLPDVPLYGLTWTVGKSFGGMTNVFLHRSKAFSDVAGHPIDLLTLAPDFDVQEATARLRAEGKLGARARLRNLWQELHEMSDIELAEFSERSSGVDAPVRQLVPRTGGKSVAKRWDDARAEELQVDRYRADGTLLSTDERDVKKLGKKGGRRITFYGRNGEALGQWTTATALFCSWLDHVAGDEPAAMIIDSQYVGELLPQYRSSTLLTVLVVHSTHVQARFNSPWAPMNQAKAKFLTHLDNFDVVSPLTRRQAEEMQAAGYADRNLRPVSNSRSFPPIASGQRAAADFLMVARLQPLKRIDHAVRAISLLRAQGVDATLTIVGDGPARESLETEVGNLGLDESVRFVGFDPAAAHRFAEHRYSLLTSSFEGQGLTLVESQVAGCVPIAYDIRYGPAEIITDGESGFLVPSGDIEQLAATMRRAAELDETEFERMSSQARDAARDYSDEAITGEWGEVIREGLERKQHGSISSVSVRDVRISTAEDTLSITATVFGTLDESTSVFLAWHSPRDHVFGRQRGDLRVLSPGIAEASFALPTGRLEHLTGKAGLWIDAVSDRDFDRHAVRPVHDWAEAVIGDIKLCEGSAGDHAEVSRA